MQKRFKDLLGGNIVDFNLFIKVEREIKRFKKKFVFNKKFFILTKY